jgi:hypothetical protein
MTYRIDGLEPSQFLPLFNLADDVLASRGIKRLVVSEPNSTPCRVSLEDAHVGEDVLLLPYQHLPGPTPYQSLGPIFVRKSAIAAARLVDTIPELQRRRHSSVRAYDEGGWMVDCDTVLGEELDGTLRRMLENERVAFLHVHNARPGCFAFRVDR